MNILLAGATGAIGVPLIVQLVASGHRVTGITRTEAGAKRLADLGAGAVIADVMDRDALVAAIDGQQFDTVVHELTDLKKAPARHRLMTRTDDLRVTGTAHLLDAARTVGATRFVTQSIFFGYGYFNHGDRPLTEDDPFGDKRGDACDPHVVAMRSTEEQVFAAAGIDGISLRYGLFYGGNIEGTVAALQKRALPVTRREGGKLAWVHHYDAAAATVLAIERGEGGEAYNIVDDHPASWNEVIYAIAAAYETPKPRVLPTWLIRIGASYAAVMMTNTHMIVSNAKAKAKLGWSPTYPSIHDGIAAERQNQSDG